MSKIIDKTWSLTEEYEQNKNNYIFTDKFPLKRILEGLSEINDAIGIKKSLKTGLEGDKKNNST
jgi:hypothetical protein